MKTPRSEFEMMRVELDKHFALEVAQRAVARGADASEVIIRHRTEFSVGVRLGDVETLKESTDRGLGLRVLIEGKQASVSGSDLRPDAISTLISEAISMARVTSPDDTAGLPCAADLATEFPSLDLFDPCIERLSTEEKIELALRAEQAAKDASPLIVNFDGGGFSCGWGTEVFANSLGFAGQYRGTSCSLATVPVASDGARMQRDYWYDVRRSLADLESPEEIGAKAAHRTIRKLGARAIHTQQVPIVFESHVARELLGDIFGAVSGESIFRKSSFLVGRLGEKIASPRLSVIDDGLMAGKLGSRPFDSEGLPTRRTVVIKEGVLESYLLNTYTGRKLGMKSTGNASRGLTGPPSVEAGNFYIESGGYSPEEIIGSVSKGFYVTELIGFGVNIVTGDYSRSASGMWIEQGELAYPVQGVTIAGNLKEMLQNVEMVGNDLDFRGSVVSPALLIGQMTVSA
ncbi:MAG: metallopeptidase TldD-related protein [Acidobacteriota bacterium]